jgi:iron complex transport system substrate-binding protein
VAPVLVYRGDGDWRDELQEIGSVVGREAEAAEWLAEYDSKAAEVKQRIAEYVEPGETFLFIRLQKDMQAASPNVHLAATLTKDLGLAYVSGLEKQKESYAALSLEVLPELNPDHIFMTVGKSTVSQDEDAEKLLAEMQQTAVWQKVSAIQKGNLHIMPQWVFGDYPNIKSKSLELVEAALVQPE